MNENDMRDRSLDELDLVDIASNHEGRQQADRARVPSRPLRHPARMRRRYMPELNVLGETADISTQSEQPVTRHLVVEVTPSPT
jgi:hypothetical protein